VVHGELQGDAAAHAVAQHVRAVDPEVVEQAHDVAREVRVGHVAVGVGGVAVTLELARDDAVALGQRRDEPAKFRSIVSTPPCSSTSGVPSSPWIS
jgi:hypothetical protein